MRTSEDLAIRISRRPGSHDIERSARNTSAKIGKRTSLCVRESCIAKSTATASRYQESNIPSDTIVPRLSGSELAGLSPSARGASVGGNDFLVATTWK